MAVLQVMKCGKQELPESFAILKHETTIGRDPKCDICLSVSPNVWPEFTTPIPLSSEL
jgi:hypothetical protein